MPRKSNLTDDPVIAELLKRKAETDKEISRKIKERRQQLSQSERKARDRVHVLIGIAYLADAHIHPERLKEIKATLERGITQPRDRQFLVSKTWLDKA